MAHLLVIDLPGGNDYDLLSAAVAAGHKYSFLTSDLALYRSQPLVNDQLKNAMHCIEIADFTLPNILPRIQELHQQTPFNALLCLLDIRLIVAAQLARKLGLAYLNPESAVLLRDKAAVRQRLHDCGIVQPAFRKAGSTAELKAAVSDLGLPVLIKPADGYGSQNIVVLRKPEDLEPWISPIECMLPSNANYGLGVRANDQLLVERYMEGQLIGCDVFSFNGQHTLIGVNEKLMFAPPSFAILGGSFVPGAQGYETVRDYVFRALDAVGFDWGATHIELILTNDGPQIVEINARLVGAKIPRLMNIALGYSIHEALIDLHLGRVPTVQAVRPMVATTRWITANRPGILQEIRLPDWQDERICGVELLKTRGAAVHPAFENADRLGCVMVSAPNRQEAAQLASQFVADTSVLIT